MREEAVNVPESAVVAAAPTSPERARNVNGGNGDKRQNPTHSRHATKCRICNHPDRHAIEFEFLNWRNPADLARSYKLRDLTTIYRHAHATGLFAKRRLNLRFAMERIVERVNEVPVTATAVIRAARAIARINDSGEWIDPPSRVIVTHINRLEDCEAPSVADAEASPAPRRRGTTKITAGSARSSLRARQVRQGAVPDIAARENSAVSRAPVIFDEVLLDEPSESATNSGELPRIDGKPAPPEVILQLTPEFARCREERRRALEADRAARAGSASRSGGFTPPASSQPENVPSSSSLLPQAAHEEPARSAERSASRSTDRESLVGRGGTCPDRSVGNRDINDGSPSPSLLPQAAFLNSASSAPPYPAATENNVADVKQSVAMPSSSLPSAAPEKPATACPELGSQSEAEALSLPKGGAKQSPRAAGPPLGSSGSANPPFPFTPEPLRRWKPRRRF